MGRRLFIHVCIGWTASSSPTQHICETPYGLEPNFEDSEECSSYWQCDGDHGATLHYCEGSDQFHFQYRRCMNDEDVSCWVQMEKYYHGYTYSPQERYNEFPITKVCSFDKGQEPNYFDEGCKSYWYCEDHQGSLHKCPDGFQFHWAKLDCVLDQEVFCEKQMERFYEHVLYKMVHSQEEEGGHRHTRVDDFHSTASAIADDVTTQSLTGSPRRHHNRQQQHRCDVAEGREPDYESETCQSFWRCVGYRGLQQKCPGGYLFHWEDRECLKNVYVDCERQRMFAGRLLRRGP